MELHSRYHVQDKICYEDVDAMNIPYENEFDIIFFKSVLGGIGRNGHDEKIEKTFSEIYKALKPGGKLYFVENLTGSKFVMKIRKKYSKACGNGWNYLDLCRLDNHSGNFNSIWRDTYGCIACIGPNETVRNILGRIDLILEKICKEKYIVSCILEK